MKENNHQSLHGHQILYSGCSSHTEKFPKSERFRMAKRLEDSVFSFYELLIEATRSTKRKSHTCSFRLMSSWKSCVCMCVWHSSVN